MESTTSPIVILIPAYDDWPSLRLLMPRLDAALASASLCASVVVVDDASTTAPGPLADAPFAAIDGVTILTLRRNIGHQRAIAVGLAWVHDNVACDAVVVMDADGEDDPADVPRLVERSRADELRRIVFARRAKRSEGLKFTTSYVLFRALYRVTTGLQMEVGNFSIVPFALLRRLVVVSEIWSHYVGGVMKARLPFTTIDTARAKRLVGQSRMNYVALVTHGLSAMAVNGDVLGVRMLIATSLMVVAALIGIGAAVVIRLFTNLAIPGWATYVVAFGVLTILQAIGLSLFFIFIILAGRSQFSIIPLRDYAFFVLEAKPAGSSA